MSITRNKYFTDFTRKLADFGVKNNEFILNVNNKEVLELDPWSDSLTTEEKLMIEVEARNNLWYFLSECVKIKSVNSNEPSNFNINLANLKALYLAEKKFNVYLSSPRQTFGTISFCAFIMWNCLKNYNKHNFKYSIIVDDENKINFILRRMKDTIILPKFMEWITSEIDSSYVNINAVINSLDSNVIDIDFVYVDDFEFFRTRNFTKCQKIIEAIKEGVIGNLNIVFKSCVGIKNSYGRIAGDVIAMSSDRFRNELFDVEHLKHSHKLFFINEPVEYLFDDSEKLINEMRRILNNNEDIIHREIFCIRR